METEKKLDLKTMMRASPFHQWLGVELVRADADGVEVRLPFREEFRGDDAGTNIHGGIISTLADITACFAMMNVTDHDAPNIDLSIEYLRMAPGGANLTAVGRVVKAGRTLGVADVEVRTEDGRLVAVGRSKLANSAPSRDTLTKSGGN